MKQMTCTAMGGPESCTAPVTGNTAEEMASNGGNHLMSTTDDMHKPMRDMMATGTEEGKKQWMADFQPKFDAAPEA